MNKINETFEKVFVITLDGSERSKKISSRFSFNYEIFHGIDGRFIDRGNSIWSNGQLGCTMSHIKLYKHIIDNKIESALILEDDAVECDDTNKIKEYVNQLPKNWGMMYLFYTASNIKPNFSQNWFLLNNGSFRAVMCTSSIGLQLDFVKEIYEFNKEYTYTADGAYTELVKQHSKCCYLLCPMMFSVDWTPSITVEVDKYLSGKEWHI